VRDLILSLVAYGCLYWFVVSVTWLTIAIIDYVVPDPLLETYNYYGDLVQYTVSPDLLASALVSAVAAFFLMRAARRSRAVESDSKATRLLARVLLYGSLAVVFVALVSDLVYALRGFFAADLPMNAALKAVAVAAYCALAGWYLLSLRAGFDPLKADLRGKIVGAVSLALTLAMVLGGGLANNSGEGSLRERRLDAKRIQDLQQIQSWVVQNWQIETGPIANLTELESTYGLTVPKDPETGKEYGYSVERAAAGVAGNPPIYTFSLCATFAASSTEKDSYDYYYPMASTVYDTRGERAEVSLPEYGWSHGGGEVCFSRAPNIVRYPQPTY
jgi:hypothetical protein